MQFTGKKIQMPRYHSLRSHGSVSKKTGYIQLNTEWCILTAINFRKISANFIEFMTETHSVNVI